MRCGIGSVFHIRYKYCLDVSIFKIFDHFHNFLNEFKKQERFYKCTRVSLKSWGKFKGVLTKIILRKESQGHFGTLLFKSRCIRIVDFSFSAEF